MAYNSYFPATYQPQYYYPVSQLQQAPATPQANNGIIWVQGEAGAKSYLVAPNNTVPLWDSETQTIYLKSADASGLPSMKVIDYTIREVPPARQQEAQPAGTYVTKEEFDRLRAEVQKMMEVKKDEPAIQSNE